MATLEYIYFLHSNIYIFIYLYLYLYLYVCIYTRVEPCIKCTRSKLDTCQGVLGLVAPEDLLSVCCLASPLVLSSVALSPPVSSCLVSSCVVCWASPGPFLDLSRASLGIHFGPPQGHFTLGGSCAFLARPWPSWRLLGPPLGRLGRLLAAESEFSRHLIKRIVFALFLNGFGPSGGLLASPGPLLAARGWLLGRPQWLSLIHI